MAWSWTYGQSGAGWYDGSTWGGAGSKPTWTSGAGPKAEWTAPQPGTATWGGTAEAPPLGEQVPGTAPVTARLAPRTNTQTGPGSGSVSMGASGYDYSKIPRKPGENLPTGTTWVTPTGVTRGRAAPTVKETPVQQTAPTPAAAPVQAPQTQAPGVTTYWDRQGAGGAAGTDTNALLEGYFGYQPGASTTPRSTVPGIDATMTGLADTSGLDVPKKIVEEGVKRPLETDEMYPKTAPTFTEPGPGEDTGTKQIPALNVPTVPETAPTDPNTDVPSLNRGENPIVNNLPTLATNYNDINNSERWFDQYGNLLGETGYSERLADRWDPNRLTYSEQFLLGDGQEGIQKMFDRLREQGRLAIDDRAAAAGTFNSGAALRGYQELEADLAAKQVQKLMELSGQSDEARVRNAAEGRQLMTAADTGKVDRLMTGTNMGRAADLAAEARAGGLTGLYDAASGRFLESKNLGRQYGVDAGDFFLRRLGQQFGVAKDTQLLGEGRATQGLKNALDVDRLRMEKDKTYADISLATEQAGLQRTSTLIDALLKNKQLDNQQALDLKKFSLDLKRFGLEKDQVDAMIAETLQRMEIDWKKLPVDIWTQLGGAMAGSASPFLLGGAEDQVDAGMKSIETQILTAGVDREQAYAKADALLKSLYGSVDPIMKALVQRRIDDAIAKRGNTGSGTT